MGRLKPRAAAPLAPLWGLWVVFIASPTHAEPPAAVPAADPYDDTSASEDAARAHFQRGVDLNAKGQIEDALVEFQAAYDLRPNYKILYNIGHVSRHVHDYARSFRAFERYLRDGGRAVPRVRRVEVEQAIVDLMPRVGRLEVRVDVAGAVVAVDGVQIGEAPLSEPVLVNTGRRSVTVSKAGRASVVRDIDVAAAALHSVDVVLIEAPTENTGTVTPPKERVAAEAASRDSLVWIGWAVTGALAVGAGVTGGLALAASNDLDSTAYAGPDRRPAEGSDIADKSASVDTLAIVTDVLVGVAVVAGGVSLYLTLTAPSSGGVKRSAVPRARVRIGTQSVSLVGTF